eukprot:TRINITY_DN121809_c0_g1_i1.p1 TRINITY_DN121809_c0_g1~~TRINITY_DN121809_c0_g1_i1.p1  ORF type:complete len:457 (+),score=117.65 TRINITY_DN121809_c0_g1_i1:95-1465(+)
MTTMSHRPATFCRMPPAESSSGMLQDISQTPQVLGRMMEKHLGAAGARGGYNSGSAPAAGESCVSLPALQKPFAAEHRFAGKTPIEVMAQCGPNAGAEARVSYSNKFTIIGCGSSFNLALLAEYLIETIARIPVEVQYASEFRYRAKPLMRPGDVFVVVSSSGETMDAVESLNIVKKSKNGNDVLTLGVVSELYSTIATQADAVLHVEAGSEIGVASTKAFTATCLAFVFLAVALGEKCGTLVPGERDALLADLKKLPEQITEFICREVKPLYAGAPCEIGKYVLWDLACQNVLAQNFIFLGRGVNFPIALEGAMKCKEVAYIHAEGYPAAEMKHGPIALIDQFMPVVCIAPGSDPCYDKIKSNIEEVKTRSGSVIAITDESCSAELGELSEYVICVPRTHELLVPLVAVIPLQLLGYMMGILRGNEVDVPRGLKKVLSVEPTPPVSPCITTTSPF